MSRITRTRIAVAAAAALAISCGGPAASAYWQTLGSNPGTARADAIATMGVPTASASAGAAAVSWAPGTTAGGRAVSGYTVSRYSSATGGTMVAAGGGCGGIVTATSCTEAALPSGTWYYTVTPKLGFWAGPESARSGGVVIADTTKPNAPTISATGTVNIGNKANAPVSGTAAAGVSSVTVTATDAQGLKKDSQPALTDSSGKWAVSNFDLSGLSDGLITYTAVAKNAVGSSSDPSAAATATKDTVAPTATVTLSNLATNTAGTAETGDSLSIKYSGDINSNTICSAWTNGVQPPEIAGGNAVTVTISSNTLTVTTSGSAGCTVNLGPVTLGTNYGSLVFKGNTGNGTPSKIVWDNATQTLKITLGTRNVASNSNVAESFPVVAPTPGVTDIAGNQAVGVAPAAASRF
ncbi:hypothetical protein [Pseudarthrobacter sp. TAF60_1]|uniref:hypothetical protein n=1 Tax=Pseudarthrobacter sp. TAF60_1 TaxID=3233071 RepID=UPI003F9B87E8